MTEENLITEPDQDTIIRKDKFPSATIQRRAKKLKVIIKVLEESQSIKNIRALDNIVIDL